jgi:hypothetical protein
MDKTEAAKILRSWRPGVDDAETPFAEALAFAQTDPELQQWVEMERKRYAAIRGKLREIEPPADLMVKIIAERPIPFPVPKRNRMREFIQLAAAVMLLAGVAWYWLKPGPQNDMDHYQAYLAQVVAKGYHMNLESDDPTRIRSFLASNQAPADYSLGKAIEATKPLGCATLSWNGNTVSMLCFRAQPGRDLWLFVVNQQAIPNPAPSAAPVVQQYGDYSTAAWEQQGRTYVLTVKGDPEVLHTYL